MKTTIQLLSAVLLFGLVSHASVFNNELECGESEDATVCEFGIEPGNAKAFVTYVAIEGSCDSVAAIRFYYSSESFEDAADSDTYADFQVDRDCDPVQETVISDLENGTTYYFRAGFIGLDGHIIGINSTQSLRNIPACAHDDDAGCQMMATPLNE